MELSTITQVMTTMVSSQVVSSTIMTAKKTCERYYWGPKCSLTCYNCELDCNKVDGSCQKCKSGFKNPEYSCKTACEKHEYGINCLGDCYKVCGANCIDSVTGRCPESLEDTLWSSLLVILMFGLLITTIIVYMPANPCSKYRIQHIIKEGKRKFIKEDRVTSRDVSSSAQTVETHFPPVRNSRVRFDFDSASDSEVPEEKNAVMTI
ncbi:multiple epidermal growth factor-like domains protein 10 [Biomphalaria pfeifferi]|uniref:Multiple epidermal growth factor-like domains protein 10 n=1 Tax=Biomphalaria pfeifferi TaxID=112525 RepID=A0AAD8FEZ0_BIOPF|nr:multiple epidermal growth factor-like domains protein 10 [Biomphalaria pfeifferi]